MHISYYHCQDYTRVLPPPTQFLLPLLPLLLPFLSQLTIGMSLLLQGLLDGLDLLGHSRQHSLLETIELIKTAPRSHLAQTHKDTTHSLRVGEGKIASCVVTAQSCVFVCV